MSGHSSPPCLYSVFAYIFCLHCRQSDQLGGDKQMPQAGHHHKLHLNLLVAPHTIAAAVKVHDCFVPDSLQDSALSSAYVFNMGSEWAVNGLETLSHDTFRIFPSQDLSHLPEYPSIKVEFTVSLKKKAKQVLSDLQNDFKIYDMEVHSTDRNRITVTGFPANNTFGKQDVLKIVQQRDSGAALISSRKI